MLAPAVFRLRLGRFAFPSYGAPRHPVRNSCGPVPDNRGPPRLWRCRCFAPRSPPITERPEAGTTHRRELSPANRFVEANRAARATTLRPTRPAGASRSAVGLQPPTMIFSILAWVTQRPHGNIVKTTFPCPASLRARSDPPRGAMALLVWDACPSLSPRALPGGGGIPPPGHYPLGRRGL